MGQTGQQDLDEGLSLPELLEQLGLWQRRQRTRTQVHTWSAILLFVGMGIALWLSSDNPGKAAEAAAAGVAFALFGIVQGILAFSSHKQDRELQICREALEAQEAKLDRS